MLVHIQMGERRPGVSGVRLAGDETLEGGAQDCMLLGTMVLVVASVPQG